MKFSHNVPVASAMHKDINLPWAEKIKERTTAIGKPVEITFFPNSVLGKASEQYDLVVDGVVDITGNWGPQNEPGRFYLIRALELPFLFTGATAAAQTAQELFDTRPEIKQEFREAKLLYFHPTGSYEIHTNKLQVKTLNDFKGLKIRGTGGVNSDVITALGATPIAIDVGEVYPSLEKGVLDGTLINWEGAMAFKYYEVTKYRTQIPQGLTLSILAVSMNLNTWNKLPPDVQKIFEEYSGMAMSRQNGQTFDKVNNQLLQVIKQKDKAAGNPDVYVVPQDELQKWKSTVSPIYDKWVADIEAKKLPGKSILDDVRRLAEKYSK